MAFEPINIFSHRIDPRGIVKLLRTLGDAKVSGSDDDWHEIIITLRKGSWFRKALVLTFKHNPNYYAGTNWPNQILGMLGYFSGFPETPSKDGVLRAVGDFRFALSVPQHDLNIESQDERLQIVYAVCQHLDGMIFTPSALRDGHGRVLLSGNGEFNSEAQIPRIPQQAEDDSDDARPSEIDGEPEPPSRERVTRRTLALTAIAARATLEIDAPQMKDADLHRQRILQWVDDLNLGDELEPDEWNVLQRPVGKLDERSCVNAMWRVEGLAVLAWSLGLCDLPPDDQLVVPTELYQRTALFDVARASELLATATLRSVDQLDAMQVHFMMLHWRLRDFSLRPEPMDFVKFSKNCWIGSFDITKFHIRDNDLAIGDVAINDASAERVRLSQSIAAERHLAANWLAAGSELYSNTDTST